MVSLLLTGAGTTYGTRATKNTVRSAVSTRKRGKIDSSIYARGYSQQEGQMSSRYRVAGYSAFGVRNRLTAVSYYYIKSRS